jgi:hypothetical protein
VRSVYLTERKKDGTPALDPTLGRDDDDVLSIEQEFRDQFVRRGFTDPGIIARLVREAAAADAAEQERLAAAVAAAEAAGGGEGAED